MIIDEHGYCSVNSSELNELLRISGKYPIHKEGDYYFYKIEITDIDKRKMTEDQLSEAYRQCEETRKIIGEWSDKQKYNRYRLDRWSISE